MKGEEMKAIRQRLGMSELQLARAIGYTGTDRNDEMRVRQYEYDKKQIPLYIARLVWLIEEFEQVKGYLPHFPDWPGYEFEHTPDHEVAK